MNSNKCVALRLMKNSKHKRKLNEETYHDNDYILFPEYEEEGNIILLITQAVMETVKNKKPRKDKMKNRDRWEMKNIWSNGYRNCSEDEFKERLRSVRESFEFILNRIQHLREKKPTRMVPNAIENHRRLTLTIYRMTHSCSLKVLKDLFGVSQSLATVIFNKVIRVMVITLYKEFAHLSASEDEWRNECKNFLENYEFPCIGAWDGFHVQAATSLKNYCSIKNKYTITSMGLV